MENKNRGINEEDTSSPNHSENRDPNHLENRDIQPNEGEFNNDEYSSEFDERDQKQNVGQIGDTYPPDDPTPTEDELSDINETSPLDDTSLATDSENDSKEAGNID